MISTVDPDARHGHKTSARGFDGYKGHIAIDPDSEIIIATGATAGNSGDAAAAASLLADLLPGDRAAAPARPRRWRAPERDACGDEAARGLRRCAYGSGELLERLEQAGVHNGSRASRRPR